MPERALSSHDLFWSVERLPQKVHDFLKAHAGEVFVAGGFIRSCITRESVSDVDVFISSAANLEAYLVELLGDPIPETTIHRTENAVTIRWQPRVQIIHRWTFINATEGIERFDFTIARAAIWYDGDSWRSVCGESYYADLAAKRIVYCAPEREEEPGGSLLRLLKFYARGYRAPLDTVGAIVARMARSATSFDSEAEYAAEFTRLLREVDPSNPRINQAVRVQPTAAPSFPIDEEEEVEF